jgi:superfamily II DNA or RNA helicase
MAAVTSQLILRDYQLADVDRIRAEYRAGHRSVLYVAPTGSGKTALSSYILRAAAALGNRGLFAAGRTELIDQTVATLATAGVTNVRVIQAERDEGDPDAPVIVGSVQTLSAPRWRGQVPRVKLIVLDEAHHAPSDQYGSIAADQPDAMLLGLSATPERQDGKPLGDRFTSLVVGPTVRQLTDLGNLVPCRVWAGPIDLKPGQLALTPLEAYQRFAAGERAAVFCRDRKHAAAELEVFQAAGIPSALVIGTMSAGKRRDILQRWRAGDIHVVTSVGVLTEGFDLPVLGCAILARRFGHAGLYLQVAGRILRTAPGKTSATLVDLAGSAHEHGPPDLEREYSLTGRAISGVQREAFGQCRECGSMFRAGPRACPHCGAEVPVQARPLPRSVGAGVSELAPARPRIPWVSAMQARREGHCRKCGRWFPAGTAIYFTVGQRGSARHQKCPLPALPSAAVTP